MSIKEMKEVLFQKLQDEGSCFKKSDIVIEEAETGYTIQIKEYTHITFKLETEEDDYFGYIVQITDDFMEDCHIFVDSKKEYDYTRALIQLGYYIGTRF